MPFNWEQFLIAHNVEYTRERRFAGRGVIAIKCPFCADDPSYHMGISVVRHLGWHCWREPTPGAHSGKAPHRLIMQLTGCSHEAAAAIIGSDTIQVIASDYTFGGDIAKLLQSEDVKETSPVNDLEFPDNFRPLNFSPRATRLFYPYLRTRGYTTFEIEDLVARFNLHYTASGLFAYRIIIPVYYRGKLVTWTARSIADEHLRYRTLSHKTGDPLAAMGIKDTLFDFDCARRGGNTLVVVEGPFDAMRVIHFGERRGIRAVALFGKAATPAQIELLYEIAPRFNRTVALLDSDTGQAGFSMLPEELRIKTLELPPGIKDPGELNEVGFDTVFR